MKSNLSRVPALLLSAFLQVAPLLRVATAEASAMASPVVAVLRWIVGATAVAGSFHAVSGATGMTITPGSTGTNGVTFGARVSISSTQYGFAKSYTAKGLPTGLAIGLANGVISGTPSKSGSFSASITGWEFSNGTGEHFTGTRVFTIANPPAIAPIISQPPVALTVTEGDSASFSVTATGTPTPTFQWTFGGKEILGATAADYSIGEVALTDAGDYAVIVKNSAGSVTSDPVTLTVNAAPKAPTITLQPISQTVTETSNVVFTVTATGTAPLAYQWIFGTTPIPGETSETLTLSSVTAAQAGSYQVNVSNAVGSMLSDEVTLTVDPLVPAGPVELSVPVVGGSGSVAFSFATAAHVAYVVESRDALGSGSWTVLANIPAADVAGHADVNDTLSDSGRFYRIQPQP